MCWGSTRREEEMLSLSESLGGPKTVCQPSVCVEVIHLHTHTNVIISDGVVGVDIFSIISSLSRSLFSFSTVKIYRKIFMSVNGNLSLSLSKKKKRT